MIQNFSDVRVPDISSSFPSDFHLSLLHDCSLPPRAKPRNLNMPIGFFWGGDFWPSHAACGILVPQPGMEPGALAMRALSPNHWATREFPQYAYCYPTSKYALVKNPILRNTFLVLVAGVKYRATQNATQHMKS